MNDQSLKDSTSGGFTLPAVGQATFQPDGLRFSARSSYLSVTGSLLESLMPLNQDFTFLIHYQRDSGRFGVFKADTTNDFVIYTAESAGGYLRFSNTGLRGIRVNGGTYDTGVEAPVTLGIRYDGATKVLCPYWNGIPAEVMSSDFSGYPESCLSSFYDHNSADYELRFGWTSEESASTFKKFAIAKRAMTDQEILDWHTAAAEA
eukprot:gb/GFBE01049396.1/.p1 GENE.gb/GFBE01049396.1/~~gb/GFBE01049396.1/.p1  ORF type:complete len:205 (+),score=27.92 gb/GFBE01049396.1/:1-615(+)